MNEDILNQIGWQIDLCERPLIVKAAQLFGKTHVRIITQIDDDVKHITDLS